MGRVVTVKKIMATAVVGALVLTGCGGNKEKQVAACIQRHDGLEEAVALDLCQGAYQGQGGLSTGDLFLVYMLMSANNGYSYPYGPFTPYGRYNYVQASPANVTVINNYGGVSATPVNPPKTSPLKTNPAAATKAPVKSPPKASEPPKTSTVPKSTGAKLPEPAKPTPTAKPQTSAPKPAAPKPAAPKPAAPKPATKR